MRKGFTLVELLAVIVILAIILAVAVPSVNGIINNAKQNAFEDNAKVLLRAINYKTAQDNSYDVTQIKKAAGIDTVKTALNIDTSNYVTVSITIQNNKPYATIIGSNSWQGLKATGTDSSVTVVKLTDITPPVITMAGSSPISVNQGSSYTDAGATASDDVDGNITSSIQTMSTVNINVIGTYTVTYNVSDSSGNAATPVVRTVNVISASPTLASTIASSLATKNGSSFYVGANPNNWIIFGQVSSIDNSPIYWRIVKSDAEGIKIIYMGSASTLYGFTSIGGNFNPPWDTTNSNKWDRPASIKTGLQDWYDNTLYVVNRSTYAQPINWCIGGISSPYTIAELLGQECVTTTGSGGTFPGRSATQTAVGFIRPSDYISTSADVSCNAYSQPSCGTGGNFLFLNGYPYATANVMSNSTSNVFIIYSGGDIFYSPANSAGLFIRPVVNLKSTVPFVSGNGTYSSPYKMY